MTMTTTEMEKYIISDLEFHLEKPVHIVADLNLLQKETLYVYEKNNELYVEQDFRKNAMAEFEYQHEYDYVHIRGYCDYFKASDDNKADTDELPF